MDEKGVASAGVREENRFAVANVETAFKMLVHNRGDVVITSTITGQDAIQALKLQATGIKRMGPPLATIALYPYLHKNIVTWYPYLHRHCSR